MKHVERYSKRSATCTDATANTSRSMPTAETFQGKTIWQGTVDVFRVRAHSKATHAYADDLPPAGSN